MPVKQPTIDELARIAGAYGLSPTREDLDSFSGLIAPLLESYSRLDQLPEPALPVKYPRSPGYRPRPEDNPLGAWYWRSEIRGAQNGPLAGKTIAIKDNANMEEAHDIANNSGYSRLPVFHERMHNLIGILNTFRRKNARGQDFEVIPHSPQFRSAGPKKR